MYLWKEAGGHVWLEGYSLQTPALELTICQQTSTAWGSLQLGTIILKRFISSFFSLLFWLWEIMARNVVNDMVQSVQLQWLVTQLAACWPVLFNLWQLHFHRIYSYVCNIFFSGKRITNYSDVGSGFVYELDSVQSTQSPIF